MKNQSGFTLVELVIVLIIVGILAVTAAPKFISLKDDAAKASLKGMKGAIESALSMSYAKMAIEGKERSPSASPDFCPDCEDFSYGYPVNAYADLPRLVENMTQSVGGNDTDEWLVTPTFGGGLHSIFTKELSDMGCWIGYTAPHNGTTTYTLEIFGCE